MIMIILYVWSYRVTIGKVILLVFQIVIRIVHFVFLDALVVEQQLTIQPMMLTLVDMIQSHTPDHTGL